MPNSFSRNYYNFFRIHLIDNCSVYQFRIKNMLNYLCSQKMLAQQLRKKIKTTKIQVLPPTLAKKKRHKRNLKLLPEWLPFSPKLSQSYFLDGLVVENTPSSVWRLMTSWKPLKIVWKIRKIPGEKVVILFFSVLHLEHLQVLAAMWPTRAYSHLGAWGYWFLGSFSKVVSEVFFSYGPVQRFTKQLTQKAITYFTTTCNSSLGEGSTALLWCHLQEVSLGWKSIEMLIFGGMSWTWILSYCLLSLLECHSY